MVALKSSVLAALALRVASVFAADSPLAEDAGSPAPPAEQLKANIVTTFPEADIFGVKLVNGRPSKAVIDITNNEAEPISFAIVTGQLLSTKDQPDDAPAYKAILRNLTAVNYDAVIPAGEKSSLPFSFALDMNPQDAKLHLTGIITTQKNQIHQVEVYNDLVSIVEAPTNIFDPQIIFLYLFLSAGFAAVCYFVYNTYIETLFPQAKRTKPTKAVKPIAVEEPLSGGEGAATGADKGYDESWIPQDHITRPTAKRVKSGPNKKKAGE